MKYRFESIVFKDGQCMISGFALGNDPDAVLSYTVMDEYDNVIKADIRKLVRNDVSNKYLHRITDNEYGFSVSFPADPGRKYRMLVKAGMEQKIFRIDQNSAAFHNGLMKLRKNAFLRNLKDKIRNAGSGELTYNDWYNKTKITKEELSEQRKLIITDDMPLFSIVIPLYCTAEKYLCELIESILNQTYGKFELCLADGSPEDKKVEQIVRKYPDERIRYTFIGENRGISDNTNVAVEMASGDFIVLCDHDDLLPENALYEFALEIMKHPETDCIYSDEDKINQNGTVVFEPHFKPDFNIDMLRSNNYICHLFAVRKTLVDQYGGFDSAYDGSQDHDFIFRMTEHARYVAHVPKVLYHWRTIEGSTALNPESKMYAIEAGARAVRANYERTVPEVRIGEITKGAHYGLYHVQFVFDEYPRVSVVIPNKDHREDLDKAIRSLFNIGTWPNLEVVVVENNSTEPETFTYYEEIQKEYGNVRVVTYPDTFNYSKINNFGVTFAKGEYLLFLNNDVEMIEPESIQEMMGYALRHDVGAVGCRLLYPDKTIQHAGVVVGIGVADHAFKGTYSGDGTYFNRAMTPQDVSAVTAAAMLTKRSLFDEVGGFDEELAVAFNDIDYCLKINRSGRKVVYNPYACFYHYESRSRGQDTTDEKNARYMQELTLFTERWKEIYQNGDPYYNPNLSLTKTDYSLKEL